MTDIHFDSLTSVARQIETKALSPVELTQSMLDRIARIDGQLNSYATVTAELAMQQAKEAEQEILAGNYRGAMHGIPVAVKDLCYTKDIATQGGLKVRRGFVPDHDSTVVARLAAAGSVLLGKLNLTEGALSAYNPEFPIPVNPWNERLWSGVSSSGSGVAVAAGLCFAAIGTDTGGSIRYPAMANGIVGLKPSYGRVSRYGVLPLAESLDHVGPMARTVADAVHMFAVIAGHDTNDPSAMQDSVPAIDDCLVANLQGLRIGIDERYLVTGTDAGLVTAIREAAKVLESLGCVVVDVSMPEEGPMDYRNLWLPLTGYEAFQAHREFYPARAGDYGGYLASVLEMGRTITGEEYDEAKKRRAESNGRFVSELEKVDAVLCPSGGMVFEVDAAPQYGDADAMKAVVKNFQGQFTIPADLAGTPTLSVPCGFNDKGWPYVMQLLGRQASEQVLCRIGHAYQQATSWHTRHPTI